LSAALSTLQTRAQWTGGGALLSADGAPALLASPLSLRERLGSRWCPEGLLAAALEADVMDVFVRLARRRGLSVLLYESDMVVLVVEELGRRSLRSLVLCPRVVVDGRAEQAAMAEGLLAEALGASAVAGALAVRPELRPAVFADRHTPDLREVAATSP
jgi:hypothetical protein